MFSEYCAVEVYEIERIIVVIREGVVSTSLIAVDRGDHLPGIPSGGWMGILSLFPLQLLVSLGYSVAR